MELQFFKLSIADKIARLSFNRPDKANSLHFEAWDELRRAFEFLNSAPDVRLVILSGEGSHFCAGIDLQYFAGLQSELQAITCPARQRERLLDVIGKLQAAASAPFVCEKPVIASIQGSCIGGGLDIAAACDLRYCTENAVFSVKEAEVGMTADLGILQRLSAITGEGFAREAALTARNISAAEARTAGLVNDVFPDAESMAVGLEKIAGRIASLSPLAVRGTKKVMNFNAAESVRAGLDFVAVHNAAFLLSADIQEVFMAKMQGRKPEFKD